MISGFCALVRRRSRARVRSRTRPGCHPGRSSRCWSRCNRRRDRWCRGRRSCSRWCRIWGRCGRWCWPLTSNLDRINSPTLTRNTFIAGHAPAQHDSAPAKRHIHSCCDESARVSTPSPTTSYWSTPIGAYRAIIAASSAAA
jgi:hypothetical protein